MNFPKYEASVRAIWSLFISIVGTGQRYSKSVAVKCFLPPPPPVSDRVKKTWTKVETAISKRPN